MKEKGQAIFEEKEKGSNAARQGGTPQALCCGPKVQFHTQVYDMSRFPGSILPSGPWDLDGLDEVCKDLVLQAEEGADGMLEHIESRGFQQDF